MTKEEIDNMSYEDMLYLWRFAPIPSPLFQGESGEYFSKVMMAKKAELTPEEQVTISKNVGWKT